MTVAEALIEAKRLVVDVGWTQGAYKRYDEFGAPSCYCAMGALSEVMRKAKTQGDAMAAVYGATALSKNIAPGRVTQILSWNDTAGRCKEDVIAAFDRAIASLEKVA